jgi:serine/threonine protein kinase
LIRCIRDLADIPKLAQRNAPASNAETREPQKQRGSNPQTSSPHYKSRFFPERGSASEWNPSIRTFEKDPYQHIDHLGSGAYGYVDTVVKVDQPSAVFARKTIRITSGRNRDAQLKSVEGEFKILHRLRHEHIMAVLEIYNHRNKMSIIMLDVADMDMKEYLEKLDDIASKTERRQMLWPLLSWPGCLIQAIDYLHEMKVKHKDLKPANILVKDGRVIITDFGIAKDLIDEETTASLMSGGAQGSPMYMAPEVKLGQRRGRAVDIFSLGCIFLEISVCSIGEPRSRATFADHRNVNGSRAFSGCPEKLLQWIWFIWGLFDEYYTGLKPFEHEVHSTLVNFSGICAELAFVMLDPNPTTRPTSRQLVQMIHSEDSIYLKDIKKYACRKCCGAPMWTNNNLPLHSTFKPDNEYVHDKPPEAAFSEPFNDGWEGAKRLWLATHMWW